ncbi:SDR family NAD(P)-dependent oxidoreductase [Rhizobium bangladeshense]|uniref:SDR family NAD(P)-dependent oxidoreductase n=1 Tax=Rhizobium bangladeshense TaxID=1138189 RepID=UPI001A99BE7F|nr:SDR family NAD(P)-dependent oxidoreductase [Rhizobium bangladeshense]QSY95250.1 SDR family NAD(P)-dependent oxidoreductase [Rhizobium bangladeshense]
MSRTRPKALITHASCAIGLVYADRLARRGYDLVLVADRGQRPTALARILQRETDARIEVRVADLTRERHLKDVEAEVPSLDLLINNLELPIDGSIVDGRTPSLDRLLDINIKVHAWLTATAARSMVMRRNGAIVNVASAVGLAPEFATGAHGATKAFVIALTRTLQAELVPDNVYVQLVIAAATLTHGWPWDDCRPEPLPGVMTPQDFVDAAMVGFDLREPVTIPSLAEADGWMRYENARNALLFDLVNGDPASRYLKRG